MIPIRPVLLRPFVAYNSAWKHEFKLAARHFLRNLAKQIVPFGNGPFEYEIRWNEGGIAVSGEAVLHMDDIYVQVSQSLFTGRPDVLYRSCRSSTDYGGNQNNTVDFRALTAEEGQTRFIHHCKALQAAEQQRRKHHAHN